MYPAMGCLITVIVGLMISAIPGYAVHFVTAQNPCDTAINIGDDQRSVDNELADSATPICDVSRITAGSWYRFDAATGGQMAEGCVDFLHCGTIYPAFINTAGSHPTTVNQVVTAQVCVNDGTSCCSETHNIDIKKCNDGTDYYVYQLAILNGCDTAYCAGTGKPCPAGKVYVQALSQCVDSYPDMTGDPVLSGPFAPVNEWDPFWFTCTATYTCMQAGDDGARFRFKWYFNGVIHNTKEEVTANSINLEGLLYETDLIGTAGKFISCGVEAYWNGSHTGSPIRTSNSFWIGINVPETKIILAQEDQSVNIAISSTVPITGANCRLKHHARRDELCTPYSFDFETDPHGNDPAREAIVCKVTFSRGDMDANVNVISKPTVGKMVPQISVIQFEEYNMRDPAVWTDYTPPNIPIQVQNFIGNGVCSSLGDPHIRPFDTNQLYDLYEPGTFLAVKSSARLFEVHLFLRTCSKRPSVSCNCGVAVREDNVVIIVDNCEKGNFRTVKKVLSDANPNVGLLTYSGNEMTILMPSGAKITAKENYWDMRVRIELPSEDKHNVKGLCGSWDDDPSNDPQTTGSSRPRPKKFTESYRIPHGQSFFDGFPECEDLNTTRVNFCTCDKGTNEPVCQAQDSHFFNSQVDDVCNGDKRRKKRQLDDFLNIYADMTIDPDFEPIGNLTWPTASGITEAEAEAACYAVIEQSAVYSSCAEMQDFNITLDVDACIADVQIADNTSAAVALLDEFEANCLDTARSHIIIGADNETDAMELVTAIQANVCPNQCTGHGTCFNSLCTCEADFVGVDCSVEYGVVPTVTEVYNQGLCDLSEETCDNIKVTVQPVIDGLICRWKILNNLDLETGEVIETNSTLISNTQLLCSIPELSSQTLCKFLLSIAVDREIFSVDSEIMVYDSRCITCDAEATCTLLAGMCIMDDTCYEDSVCRACESAIDIGHPHRSPIGHPQHSLLYYNTSADDDVMCDVSPITPGNWYWFDAYTGNQMAETCPDLLQCGTLYPVWLRGAHPTANNPVAESLLCGNTGLELGDNSSCCDWNTTVKIRYCTDVTNDVYYVYQLPVLPLCNMDFCAGDKEPCADGYAWNYENSHCKDIDECASNPCIYGTCSNELNQFNCTCQEGYNGFNCENDAIDDCASFPCIHGSCNDLVTEYTCNCEYGYTGNNCEVDIDDCEGVDCNHGTCEDRTGNYTCTCERGYTGYHCEEDNNECASNPCVYGTCSNELNQFTCSCQEGYIGFSCENEIDECASSPCIHGSCNDLVAEYTCTCDYGYTGSNCEVDIDDCEGVDCNNGTCEDRTGNYTCTCERGYTGYHCEEDINECASNPCVYGTCSNELNQFTCSCQEGYVGFNCENKIDECASSPCIHGSCNDLVAEYTCTCDYGYTGSNCEVDIDDCEGVDCNNGTCEDRTGNYTCTCERGYTGYHCKEDINECASNPCVYGTCSNELNQFTCSCQEGYVGFNCENKIDECASSPCIHGSCNDLVAEYTCTCDYGYTGSNCEVDIDDCEGVDCNNGTCEDRTGNYTCTCERGYTGYHCKEDINECASNPCVYGTCSNELNQFTCSCQEGYVGFNCENKIDECASSPCIHGSCNDLVAEYTCTCDYGYTGSNCEVDIDDCDGVDCNNGTCEDITGNYTCTCERGYTGYHCEEDINECASNPCVYGTCSNELNQFTCSCQEGYVGFNCENKIDECASSPCIHGSCNDLVAEYTCTCDYGYTGSNCEVDIDDCEGVDCNNGTCEDRTGNYTCTCERGYTGYHCKEDINECASNPCVYGTCSNELNQFTCSCQEGYVGFNCENKIDECASSPCILGSCNDLVAEYTCTCDYGYTGSNCEVDIDDCEGVDCNNGTCEDRTGNYTCTCERGYTGYHCKEDINECASNPCVYGTCSNELNQFTCSCQEGYVGFNCENKIDECASSPCIHGSCNDLVAEYTCTCDYGYTGSNCEVDIDDCEGVDCNNGTCEDRTGNYTCTCERGYTGYHCKEDINECASNPCVYGTCSNELNQFTCSCQEGYVGFNCENKIDECASSPCIHGSCNDLVAEYTCTCDYGYTGSNCEVDIDDCEGVDCNNGTCEDRTGNYTCTCERGYTGYHCKEDINECASNPCVYGTCSNELNQFTCSCQEGYVGFNCENKIDECASSPCIHGSCNDLVAEYTCTCDYGYTGSNCEVDIDDCDGVDCNNGTCEDRTGNYTCTCERGYTGYHCEEDINECASNPCVYGTCSNELNQFTCSCQEGYVGFNCENKIDECASSPCIHGSCNDLVAEYTCTCDYGYTGSNCEVDIDDCEGVDCNNGTCEDRTGNYTCTCERGYTGYHCEEDINECASNPCVYGTCSNELNQFTCSCQEGYIGFNCENKIDECASFPCIHGSCNDLVAEYTCTCDYGYTGSNCEVDIDDCEGVDCNHGTCEDRTGNYTCTCERGYTGFHCEEDINECASNPCVYGKCSNELNQFTCSCQEGYIGFNCKNKIDECASSPCIHGSCNDLVTAYTCTCDYGYTGNNCEVNIDDCEGVDCNNGTCEDRTGNYTCTCELGYTGYHCEEDINECASNPCVYGTCSNELNQFTCSCQEGYVGFNCENKIDECASSPCIHGSCNDLVAEYTCTCDYGYTGSNCEVDIDDCEGVDCNNGMCEDRTRNYTCTCERGYTGYHCEEDINECASNPCVYGTCSNELNQFTCSCQEGYIGFNCENKIDECASSLCIHGSCNDLVTEYTCTCDYGYTGNNCEVDIDDCEGVDCNHGTCEDRTGNYTCTCERGFTGYHCGEDINECASNPCVYGRCSNELNQFTCSCQEGYIGFNCENKIDECASSPCIHGSCNDLLTEYTCTCDYGYTGNNCEVDIDDCEGVDCNHGMCEDRTGNYTCTCERGYTGYHCEEGNNVEYGVVPIVTELYNQGLCDLSTETCHNIKVTAQPVIDGLICRWKILNNLDVQTGEVIETKSTLISNTHILCSIPELSSQTLSKFLLSIAVDRKTFSVDYKIMVYDSGCITCDAEATCTLLDGMCIMNDTCYEESVCGACESAIDIGHPHRSPLYNSSADEDVMCDVSRITTGYWYWFDAYTGNQMAETCPDLLQCGTLYPVWLSGAHPTANNPVAEGLLCGNTGQLGDNSFCCDWNSSVNIRYCTDDSNDVYYAYQLPVLPFCNMAFCAGDREPCVDGYAWNYENSQCKVEYGVAPTVTELYNQGLCDLSRETCDNMKVTALPVIEGLICRWKILNNLDVETGEVIETNSILISNTQVLCSIPALSSQTLSKFLLSIAVDRETFSVDYKITVYDSECIICDGDATCTLLDGRCIMEDTCYEESVCGACESAIDIGHPQRSPVYTTSADDDVMCDVSRITPGYWYWFDEYTGKKMTETCPDLLQCGTMYPVWLSGAHPTSDNPVAEGLLCGNTGIEFGDNSSCCDWNTTVNIRYCTDVSNDVYYVYQLPVLPFCNMAFCAGDREPCADGYAWNYENSQCKDIDECASNPCLYGTCSNELNQFTCTCQEGYNGLKCETDAIDACASSTCMHGSCNDLVTQYTCTCDIGYTGSNCEVDIDDCKGVDCNYGTCEDGTAGYTCTCKPGYTGYHCEEETPTGADFKIPFNDFNQAELNEDSLKRAIANSVNEFCVLNLDTCCSDMRMTYRAVGIILYWPLTDFSLIEVYHGGPTTDNTYFKLTIFVNVSTEAALDVCISHNSYPGLIPLGGNVITSSVEHTGIFMSPASTQTWQTPTQGRAGGYTQTGQTPTEGSTGDSNALIIGVACGAAGLLTLIIIIVIIVTLKRSQSRKSVNLESLRTDIRPQSAKIVIYDNPSEVGDNDADENQYDYINNMEVKQEPQF